MMGPTRSFVTRPLPPYLHRVGWATNPLAFRPRSTMEFDSVAGRFDDPDGVDGIYRTFYAANTALGAMREKLLSLRPDGATLDRLAALDLTDLSEEERQELERLRVVPESFLTDFALTTIEVLAPCDVVDVTASGTFDAYLDHTDKRLCVDDVLDSDCTLAAQRLGRKIWQLGYAGVMYPSRHGTDILNYALFETDYGTDAMNALIRQVDVQPLDENCSVLKAVAAELRIDLGFAGSCDPCSLWVELLRTELERAGDVTWYVRERDRGVRYYSMRIPGLKISVLTFPASAKIEVDAITTGAGAHVAAAISDEPGEVLLELAKHDANVASALAVVLAR